MSSRKPNRLRTLRLSRERGLGAMDELLSVRLRGVHVFLSRGLSAQTEALGLKSGSISALSLIAANPGISQNEVGETIGTDRSTMVDLIGSLEERGWIARERSSTDRRRYLLQVTDQGRETLDKVVAAVKRAEDEMLEQLSFEDEELLRDLLQRAHAACLRRIGQSELHGQTDELYRQV